MSVDYRMKIIRFKNGNKEPEILCEVEDYNKIKSMIDDLEEAYNYPDSLDKLLKKDEYFYKIITLDNIRSLIQKKKADIEKCKDKIAEIKENLKAYYAGGKHCPEIEEDLREELSIYEECINPDSEEDNDIWCLRVAETVENDIIFVSEYLKPLNYDDKENGLYMILEGNC